MREAYGSAIKEICRALEKGGNCLDCGAGEGQWYQRLHAESGLAKERYEGVEWNERCVTVARQQNLNVKQGNLNTSLEFQGNSFKCVFALSVLEHLLNGCQFVKECHRILEPGGSLILLTPNISTLFNTLLLVLGRMPSTGPHPDSKELMRGQIFTLGVEDSQIDIESDTPIHRHLVVFSYRVLRQLLQLAGFTKVYGQGFGWYPLPTFLQPLAERIDPFHCHQMVFIATK